MPGSMTQPIEEDILRFASCMAPNAEPLFLDTVNFIAKQIPSEASAKHDVDWPERERMLDAGEIEVGWICGLPYIWKADLPSPVVELLVAPVMLAERYGDEAVYFSDVMVRTESPVEAFSDLRGARWAYNEPRSHSGYNVIKSYLFDIGETGNFFASIHEAGSHERALEWILAGFVDSAAIDTTVYETIVRSEPDIATKLRPVEILGPSPIPPWVVSTDVDLAQRKQLQQALTRMHLDTQGRQILQGYGVARYEVVTDSFYDPIRSMAQKARQVPFESE